MISNHVTYFILFHWSDIFFFFSFLLHFHSSRHWHPRMLSRLCEFVIEVPHGLHWCIFYLILFMGGGGVCFLECRETSAPSPSLSAPSLAVPGVIISMKSIDPFPVPVLHSLVWLVPVWMCSLVHHALLRSISLALPVLLWAGENEQKGYQLFRRWEMGFPWLIFCIFFQHCLFLNSVWSVHTQSKTEKRISGAFSSFAFSFISVGLSLIYFLFKLRHDSEKPTPIFVFHAKIKA